MTPEPHWPTPRHCQSCTCGERASDYAWPEPSADSIRAQLTAEREARQAERLAELLGGVS